MLLALGIPGMMSKEQRIEEISLMGLSLGVLDVNRSTTDEFPFKATIWLYV